MGLLSAAKKLTPIAVKRPLHAVFENWAPALTFDHSNLLPGAEIDLSAIMTDATIEQAFDSDNSAISAWFEFIEVSAAVNPGDSRAIYCLVASLKPSTIYIASALRRFAGAAAAVTTVDISDVNAPAGAWSWLGLTGPPNYIIARLGLATLTTFVTMPARDALQAVQRYDLIFLDGDHSSLAVYREIAVALRLLKHPGLILLHDFYPGGEPLMAGDRVISGPAAAAARIMRETDALQFIPLGNLPWETKFGGNATSLALVAKRT